MVAGVDRPHRPINLGDCLECEAENLPLRWARSLCRTKYALDYNHGEHHEDRYGVLVLTSNSYTDGV